jgi:BASS family bile acid:Na+ symporter
MTIVVAAFNVSMVVTVFAYALHADVSDLRYLLDRPRLLVLSLVSIFVLTPAIALAVVTSFDMPTTAKVGIVALSLSIVPPLMPQKFIGQDGEHSYAVGLTLACGVLAVVVIPLQVAFLGDLMGHPYGLNPAAVGSVVFGLMVVPLLIGLGFRRLWPAAAARLAEPLPRIAGRVTSVALLIVLVVVAPSVWDTVNVGVVAGMVVFGIGALATGHLLGGPDRIKSGVLAISSASRHPSIAFTIATANYPGRNFIGVVVLCLAIVGVLCTAYTKWLQRLPASEPPSTTTPTPAADAG